MRERGGAGSRGPSNKLRRMLDASPRSSSARSAIEFAGHRLYSSLKSCQSCLSCATSNMFVALHVEIRRVGSRHFGRMGHARTSVAQVLFVFERVQSQSKERVKQTKGSCRHDEEGFDADCRARRLGGAAVVEISPGRKKSSRTCIACSPKAQAQTLRSVHPKKRPGKEASPATVPGTSTRRRPQNSGSLGPTRPSGSINAPSEAFRALHMVFRGIRTRRRPPFVELPRAVRTGRHDDGMSNQAFVAQTNSVWFGLAWR